jgi:hypothetical protein
MSTQVNNDYVFTIRTQDDVTRQYVINMITNMSSAERFTLHGKEYKLTMYTDPFDLISTLSPARGSSQVESPRVPEIRFYIPVHTHPTVNKYEVGNWVKTLPTLNPYIISRSWYLYSTTAAPGLSMSSGCNENLWIRHTSFESNFHDTLRRHVHS